MGRGSRRMKAICWVTGSSSSRWVAFQIPSRINDETPNRNRSARITYRTERIADCARGAAELHNRHRIRAFAADNKLITVMPPKDLATGAGSGLQLPGGCVGRQATLR